MTITMGKVTLYCPVCQVKMCSCTSAIGKHIGQCPQCGERYVCGVGKVSQPKEDFHKVLGTTE